MLYQPFASPAREPLASASPPVESPVPVQWEVRDTTRKITIEVCTLDLPKRGMLPDTLGLIGLEKTLLLVHHFSGKRLFFPLKPSANHPLEEHLGRSTTERLCAHFGGDRLEVPLWRTVLLPARNRLIRKLSANGESTNQLAMRFGLCMRQVRNICTQKQRP